MPLSAAQRTAVRDAFLRLARGNKGFTSGNEVTPEWWADQQMARLDGYHQMVFPRAHFEVRVYPWMDARLWELNKATLDACARHCRGA